MAALVITLCITLLGAQTAATSAAAPANSSPQENRATLTARDISQLQAQAESGDSTAELHLAQAYERGNGISQSEETAAKWYTKAAERGNPEAENQLGVMYLTGEGVPRDKQQAVAWYHKAARQGNAGAMFNLGAAYYNGDGVDIDDALSYAWFTLAQEAGDPKAGEAVQRAESELKPWAITEAFKSIAELYEEGQYLPENRAEAARWWLKAANRGDADAQVTIGVHLLLGQGIPPDPVQGQYWCEQVAKQRDPRGEDCMGYLYRHGLGVKADPKEARRWYEQSAQQNDVLGTKMLAEMDASGEGGKADGKAACLLYARLALAGDKDSLQRLALLKPQISRKDWENVEKQLSLMHVDLSKLNGEIRNVDSNARTRTPELAQPR